MRHGPGHTPGAVSHGGGQTTRRTACALYLDHIGDVFVVGDLVKVQVLVDLVAALVDDAHVGQVFLFGRNTAQARADGSQLGRPQVHVRVLAKAVGEVARAGRHDGGAFAHLRLV